MEDKSRQTELFTRARRGDVDALNQLIAFARSRLIDHARRTTLNNDLAEDAVQETLLAVQAEFEELNGIEHFWGWLHTTLNYKILKEIRRSSKPRATRYLADVEGEMKDDNNSSDTLADVVTGELRRAVVNAMDKLSPWHRAVLSLRCYESLSFSEIARRLGSSTISARVRFYRAKQALAKNLASNGFSRVLLPVALVLFGKLTASTKAAAASIAVPAAAMQAGFGVTAISLATAKTTLVAVAAAGLITGAAVVMHNGDKTAVKGLGQTAGEIANTYRLGSPPSPPSPPSPLRQADAGIGEMWYYYPGGSFDSVLTKSLQYSDDGRAVCTWLQNGSSIYRYDAKTNTVCHTNCRYLSPDLSVAQLPTDTHEFLEFLATVQQKPHDFQQVGGPRQRAKNLLIRARSDGSSKEITDAARHPNLQFEDVFNFPWPGRTKVADNRDQMHKRGWTYFTLRGSLNGKSVTGRGRIPFVYDACRKNSPWLSVQIGDQQYADCDSGMLFAGLSRPWEGLHTLDTIRRDAAEQRLQFETRLNQDATKATVTVNDLDLTMVYTVDMQKDSLDSIELAGSTKGKILFNYIEGIEQSSMTFTAPQRNRLPDEQNTDGLKWLVNLAG